MANLEQREKTIEAVSGVLWEAQELSSDQKLTDLLAVEKPLEYMLQVFSFAPYLIHSFTRISGT